MIVDAYIPHYESRDVLYCRWRDKDGSLIEKHVTDFEPYFWANASDRNKLVSMVSAYPGARIDWNQMAVGRNKEELVKVLPYRHKDIWGMRKQVDTWEADMKLSDRYLIDSWAQMPDWKPRVWHIDLEWDPKDKFTTVIGIADSQSGEHVAFCWSEESAEQLRDWESVETTRSMDWENSKGQVSDVTYRRVLCNSEKAIYTKFLDYLEECNPDVIVAHALMWADLPHIIARLSDRKVLGKDAYRRLSPIGRVMKPDENGYKKPTMQPIAGRLCFDTAASLESGTGFERVWKDSGKPQLASRKLDFITGPDLLDYGGKLEMSVFTGWYERFDEFVDYCMRDVALLKRMDEDNHILAFFFALQRVCGVAFDSTHNVTRFARGLIGRRTDTKAPTNIDIEPEDYPGGHIPAPTPGRYQNVAVVDYKQLYPSIIQSHNLSWESRVDRELRFEDDVRELPDGTCWRQGKPALLPRIVTELVKLRDEYKGNMKTTSDPIERSGWNTMQLAVKRCMASLYGMCASTYWGWAAPDIASAITACGREAVKFLMEESEKQGYNALYGHTDSAFVQIPFDEVPALAEHLTQTVQREHQASHFVVEFEAFMPYWVTGGKNLYYGICSWPPEDEGKAKSARWGKISTLSPVSRTLEKDVLNMLCKGADENEVVTHVREISLRIKSGDIDIPEVSGVTRIQKDLWEYAESVGVPGVKGARYYNLHLSDQFTHPIFKKGDSVKWVYAKSDPNGRHIDDIVAYHEAEDLDGFTLDHDKMVQKLVVEKIKPMFKAMKWSTDYASGMPRPKTYW